MNGTWNGVSLLCVIQQHRQIENIGKKKNNGVLSTMQIWLEQHKERRIIKVGGRTEVDWSCWEEQCLFDARIEKYVIFLLEVFGSCLPVE